MGLWLYGMMRYAPDMLAFRDDQEQALLMLGRLDGRLSCSPAADIWLARARLKGAAALAGLAGAPVTVSALQDWICGRSAPPRHSEGLNDPLSIAALVHFALSASAADSDPLARATLNVLRTLLDDRKEAEIWAAADLVRFGPAWRAAQAVMEAPSPAPSLRIVADRILAARGGLEAPTDAGQLLTTVDGRQFRIDPRRPDMGWIIACHLPAALAACGVTMRRLPCMVDLPRFPAGDVEGLAGELVAMLGRQAREGLAELDRIEARLARLPAELGVTRRSKAPLLMRLELAYPGLSKTAIARLLGISHQGATKLEAQMRGVMGGRRRPGAGGV